MGRSGLCCKEKPGRAGRSAVCGRVRCGWAAVPSRFGKSEKEMWQRRFWEHHIRDEADYAAHVRYCWWNPVKHGFVEAQEAWPHSSVHHDKQAGRFGW